MSDLHRPKSGFCRGGGSRTVGKDGKTTKEATPPVKKDTKKSVKETKPETTQGEDNS